MAASTGFDPSASNVDRVQYVTPTDDNDAFIESYPAGQTLTELSPKGVICQPGTLAQSPTLW